MPEITKISQESSESMTDDAYESVMQAFNAEIEKLKKRHLMSSFLTRLEGYKTRFENLCKAPDAPDYQANLIKLCQDVERKCKQKRVLIGALYCFAALGAIGAFVMGAILMPSVVIPAMLGAALTAVIGGGSVGGLFVLMGGSIVGSGVEGRKLDALDCVRNKLKFFSGVGSSSVNANFESTSQPVKNSVS